MPEWIPQIIISLVGAIVTLVGVIAINNNRDKKEASGSNGKDKSGEASSIGKIYDKITENKDNQTNHCADRLAKCTQEFKEIAMDRSSIQTKLDNISVDITEIKTMVKNGSGKSKTVEG